MGANHVPFCKQVIFMTHAIHVKQADLKPKTDYSDPYLNLRNPDGE